MVGFCLRARAIGAPGAGLRNDRQSPSSRDGRKGPGSYVRTFMYQESSRIQLCSSKEGMFSDGESGRRVSVRSSWPRGRTGSSPARGTQRSHLEIQGAFSFRLRGDAPSTTIASSRRSDRPDDPGCPDDKGAASRPPPCRFPTPPPIMHGSFHQHHLPHSNRAASFQP